MRPIVTVDEAFARAGELFQGWVDDETIHEDELDREMASQIVEIADQLRQPEIDKFIMLRKVEAFFVQHYGEHLIEVPSYELGVGPIAMTWRTVRAALRDAEGNIA